MGDRQDTSQLSDSLYNTNQPRKTSPLRSYKNLNEFSSKQNDQSIRNLIAEKERQLEEMRQQTEALKVKLSYRSSSQGGGQRVQSDAAMNPKYQGASQNFVSQTSNAIPKYPNQYQKLGSPLRMHSKSPPQSIDNDVDLYPSRPTSQDYDQIMKRMDHLGQRYFQQNNQVETTMQDVNQGQSLAKPKDTVSNSEKLQMLKIDSESLRRRLGIVESEVSKVKEEQRKDADRLDKVSSSNQRLQIVIRDDQEIVDRSKTEYQQVQRQKLENEVISKDIDIVNEGRKQHKDKLTMISQEIEDLQQNAKTCAEEIETAIQRSVDIGQDRIQTDKDIKDFQDQIPELQLRLRQAEEDLRVTEDKYFAQKNIQNSIYTEYEDVHSEAETQKAILNQDQEDLKHKFEFKRKQIVAATIFKVLTGANQKKHREAIALIKEYSTFEKACNASLRKLAIFINRRAGILLKDGLSKWFKNGLKPQDLARQNIDLVVNQRNRILLHKAFFEMISQQIVSKDKRNLRSNSIHILASNRIKVSLAERKRALMVWKQYCLHMNKLETKIKALILKTYRGKLSERLNAWKKWSLELNQACRLTLLHRQYIQNLYLSSVTSDLKVNTVIRRHLRFAKLNRIFKYWRDFQIKRKFMVQQHIATSKFLNLNRLQTLQECFSAMRLHKEGKKEQILVSAVENDVDVSLAKLSRFIDKTKQKNQRANNKFKVELMKNMMGKQLYGYFQKWKDFTEYKREMIRKRIKDQIFTIYRQKALYAFQKMKAGAIQREQSKKKKRVMMVQMESEQLQEDVKVTNQAVKVKVEAVRSAQDRKVTKQNNLLEKRYQKNALLQWSEIIHEERYKESQSNLIIFRIRRNYIKQAFDRYKGLVQNQLKLEFNSKRALDLQFQFNLKKMRKIYVTWQAYNYVNKENARLLRRFLMYMMNGQKKRFLMRWKYGSKLVKEGKMLQTYQSVGDSITIDNQELAKHINRTDKQVQELRAMNENQINNARRQLKNYMMRLYDNRVDKAFRLWKRVYTRHSRRDTIMKNAITHYYRKNFELALLAFKNNSFKEKKKIKKQAIFEVQMEVDTEQNYINKNQHEAESYQKSVKAKIEVRSSMIRAKNSSSKMKKANFEIQEEKVETVYNMIINRNLNKTFVSKKRQLFDGWRRAIYNQRRFMNAISTVLTKGMYCKGLDAVLWASRKRRNESLVEKVLTRHFLTRYQKSFIQEAFHIWKEQEFLEVTSSLRGKQNDYVTTVKTFKNEVISIKGQNTKNVLNFLNKRWRNKIWKAWCLSRRMTIVRDYQMEQSKGVLATTKQRRAIQKWYLRVEETRRIRFKWKAFHTNYKLRMKFKVFEVLQFKQNVNNTMAKVMGNLEKFMRTKILDDSFKDVKSFSISKKLATDRFKRRATFDITSLLNQRQEKVTRIYFGRFRHKVFDNKFRVKRLRAIYGKINSQLMHTGFRKWGKYTDRHMDEQEQNETGPVTEMVFEGNRLIKNLQDFMRAEGYNEEHIKRVHEHAVEQQHNRLHKSLCRWNIFNNKDKKLMIKAFDHLRMAVKMRKLLRYWLNFSNNRVQHVKADMQEAFRKWAIGDNTKAIQYDKLPITYLMGQNMKQSLFLQDIADKEHYNDAVIKHLSLQRDELLAHYIRGQKMALSLCHTNHIKGKGKYFNRWKGILIQTVNDEAKSLVMAEIKKLTQLKEVSRRVEQENSTLADENDELRQFSIDGFKIAKSINSITVERETLTTDLADYAKQISALIQRQEQLEAALEAQLAENNRRRNRR